MNIKERARLITIKAKHRVLSHLEGLHKTFVFGEEDDLKNIREYTYGDDIRKISWIITARERKPFVIEREEVKSQNIKISLLLDQEFLFKNKLEKAIEIYSLLGYAAIFQRDKLETFIITDTLEKFFKHKNSPVSVEEATHYISGLNLKNKTFKPEVLKILSRGKRSLLVLIGDFVYPVDLFSLSLKHKIFIIVVRDRDEENPSPYKGYQLKSFDEKKKIPYLRKEMVNMYIENLKKIDRKLSQFLSNKKIPHIKIYTDEDPLPKLKKLFS